MIVHLKTLFMPIYIHANTQANTHAILLHFHTVHGHTTDVLLCCYIHYICYIIIISCSDNLMHVGHVLCDNNR